jgi:hypothetical protein
MQFTKISTVAILFVLSFLGLAMASPVARSTETDAQSEVGLAEPGRSQGGGVWREG